MAMSTQKTLIQLFVVILAVLVVHVYPLDRTLSRFRRLKKDLSCNYEGSTPQIETIFTGRCYDFQNVIHESDCDYQHLNCSAIWSEFSTAILNKEPCSVTISSFDTLLEISNHPIAENKSIFWSGTYLWAHEST